jgi:hypothetical protein
MSSDKDNQKEKGPAASKAPVKKVRVICEGVLGTKLLKNGDTTTDPEYLALAGDSRDLVEPVE